MSSSDSRQSLPGFDHGSQWTAATPPHWTTARLKHVAAVQTGVALGKSYGIQPVKEYPYLRVANVQDGFLDLADVKHIEIPKNEAMSCQLQAGDVLMNEGGDADKLGRGAIWSGEISPCLHQNHVFAVRPMRITPQWLNLVTSSEVAKAFFESRAKQSTNLASISATNLKELPVPCPPTAEQQRITQFIDIELSRIDTLAAAKENLLTILVEKRHALVSQAVTRGLDPNVKMRDSGVPWLGEIPAHWEIERSRWLFRVRDERSETGDEELLTVSHITGVTPRSEKDVNMFEAESTVGYKVCQPGDLVINTMWAWMGAMGIAPCVGIVSPSYHVYHVGARLVPEYVDAIVRTQLFAKEVTRFSKGVWSSRLRLYPEGFFEVMFPVPSIEEQQKIVDFIRREQQQIDGMSSAVERSLVLLRERREAVIAAAVTGQLDVGAA